MLTREQKISVLSSFPELTRTEKSYDRINFEYRASKRKGYVLATQLHHGGNGYICGKYLDSSNKYKIDSQGWIKIRDFDKNQLRTLVKAAIHSMSV